MQRNSVTNFSDTRIIKRILKINTFIADNWFYTNVAKKLHAHKKIEPVFGKLNHKLNRFIFENSLIRCSNYVNGDHPYSYIPNYPGLAMLLNKIKIPLLSDNPHIAIQTYWAQTRHSEFLSGDVELEYKDTANRSFNEMQYLKKDVKNLLLKGWIDNDIETCVITLIYQLALNTADPLYKEHNEYDVLQYAIEYKDEFRNLLTKDLNLPIKKVKELVNSMVLGGRLCRNKNTKIWQAFEDDGFIAYENVENAQSHPLIKGLMKDLKTIWKNVLKWDFEHNKTDRCIYRGNTGRYSSQKHKAGIYFKLENQIGVVIKKELKRQKGNSRQMLWMHDGFIDPFDYDIKLITNRVEEDTSFIIKIKQNLFEY